MASGLGINSYIVVKKEATEGVAVKPDTYLEAFTVEEDQAYVQRFMTVAATTVEKNFRAVIGRNEAPKLTVKAPAQAKTLGHFLQMAYGAPTTTGPTDTSAYTHQFNVATTIPTYTVDVASKDFTSVHRYIGVKADKLGLSVGNDILEANAGLQGLRSFIVARVTTTASSGTTLVISSTDGLTLTDTITVSKGDSTNSADYSISAINVDGVTLTLGSSITGKAHTAGDRVVIKSSTPSYALGSTFTMPGASDFSIGTTIGAVAAYDAEEFSFEFTRDLEPRWAYTGTKESDRFPVALLPKAVAASTSFKWYYQDPKWIDYVRGRSPLAVSASYTGASLAGAATAYDSLTIAMPELYFDKALPKFIPGDNIVEQEMSGTPVYNASAGYTSRVTLVNGIASY